MLLSVRKRLPRLPLRRFLTESSIARLVAISILFEYGLVQLASLLFLTIRTSIIIGASTSYIDTPKDCFSDPTLFFDSSLIMSSSMSSLNPPQTPQGQRGFPRSSQTIPTSVLTPEAQEKFKTLKRKASELSDQDSPKTASLFLQWRRSILAHEITMLNYLREQYKETLDLGRIDKETYEDYRGQIVSTLEKYENELAVILEQNQFLRQDIQDNSADIAEEAYVEELYNSFRKASDEGQKEQRQKKQRAMPRKEFRKKVTEYLDTFRQETPTSSDEAWCLALGQWLPSSMVKCAHIVPFSFESKELSYLFGVEDSALTSAKNGLFFNRVVEAGFDNGWIVIVPDGSVDSTPTEWKIILLNEKIKNDTIYTGPAPERQITRWVVSDFDFLKVC